jgi:hypothetical protein
MDGAQPSSPSTACSAATPEEILGLAEEYANTAVHLFEQKDKALGHRPAHLCALHAIELYLHAFLKFRGATSGRIKARQHDLWHQEFAERLDLDTKTCKHLRDLSETREYRTLRYAPQQPHSPKNRMERTLQAIRGAQGKIPFSP